MINKTRTFIRLTFPGALLAWAILIVSEVMIVFSRLNDLPAGVPFWLPRAMFFLYVLFAYYHFKLRIERNEHLSFTDLLWRIFAVGLIVTVMSLGIRFLISLLGSSTLTTNELVSVVILQLNVALVMNLLLTGVVSLKRLIMYQKTKWLVRLWGVFELFLLLVLTYACFDWLIPTMSGVAIYVIFGLAILFILTLSTNVRWVAYLNVKQKWTSLLLLLLIFFYLTYFSYSIVRYVEAVIQNVKFIDLNPVNPFMIVLLAFITLYSLFSFLVILFNLPTSSVFEQKLEETLNFQRISQSVQTEQSEESVYNILLESSVSTVFADAAWLEIRNQQGKVSCFSYKIGDDERQKISERLTNINGNIYSGQKVDKLTVTAEANSLKGTRFRSILALPIDVKGIAAGNITLLKELPRGFNKEMTRIVKSFAIQAGISIENFRLLEEAFQNERYKEELKIAKEVQKSLLPQKLEEGSQYVIQAFSQSADEVGGDYYDTLRISDHEVAWIIADVSGKGTSAAFYMSQMKGIFHSLAQLGFDSKEFMVKANMALRNCLERGSFISAAYFVVNTKEEKITYSRAGHCPILYYNTKKGETSYLADKGTALGMVRGSAYEGMVHTYDIAYKKGDIMVLYTDGIIETSGMNGEEFGYERLEATLRQVTHRDPADIEKHILDRLYEFSGTRELNDDYTTMIIKFN